MFGKRVLLSVGLVAAFTEAAQIDISVGKDGSLKFDPDSTTAAQGDILAFHFYPGGHSVVTSSFDSPCMPGNDPVFSGYIKGDQAGDMTYLVTVNNTDPMWYYCSLSDHCSDGMVGVVNPPSDHTLSDYANAAKLASASAADNAEGGMSTSLAPGSTASMAMNGSSMSSMTMSSTSTSAATTETSNAAPTAGAFMAMAGVAGGMAALLL